MRRPSGTCPAPSSQRRAAGDSITARQGRLGTEEEGKARGRKLEWGEGGDRGTFEWGPPPPSLGCGSLGGACLPAAHSMGPFTTDTQPLPPILGSLAWMGPWAGPAPVAFHLLPIRHQGQRGTSGPGQGGHPSTHAREQKLLP